MKRENLVGSFAGRMRFLSRCRRGFRRCSAWSRGGRFLVQVDDRGGEIPVLRENGQGQGGKHEDECGDDGKFAQEICRPAATEHRLTGTAECRTDFCSFAGLQQNGADHEQADDDMNDDE